MPLIRQNVNDNLTLMFDSHKTDRETINHKWFLLIRLFGSHRACHEVWRMSSSDGKRQLNIVSGGGHTDDLAFMHLSAC